ncbi:hypothetical protein GF323_03370 [Candidatus Woesearchaeota archaeon]|nr:hypothetical protein [Candidatus Woesearchaeota archaeon]
MKIAISSDGENLDSNIDQRFGRCRYFIIVDTNKQEGYKAVKNQGAIHGHGAGIQAAQQLGNEKVKAVITGNLGPNATAILDKIGIRAYHGSGVIREVIAEFNGGKLNEIKNVAEPHAGIQKQQENKAERIFFPLLDNKGEDSEISQHFGHAPFFGLYDAEKKELRIIENNLDHTDPAKSPIGQIEEAVNPTTIFAKGIGGRAIQIIQQKGLKLKTGDFNTVKEAVENLDKLEDQTESCGH